MLCTLPLCIKIWTELPILVIIYLIRSQINNDSNHEQFQLPYSPLLTIRIAVSISFLKMLWRDVRILKDYDIRRMPIPMLATSLVSGFQQTAFERIGHFGANIFILA